MTNREKLASIALYDLLCRMQAEFRDEPACVLELLEAGGCRAESCRECIRIYLNEKYDE